MCASENHPRFNPSKSSTFRDLRKPLSIHYGTGSMEGVLGSDTVIVSEAPGQPAHTFPSPPALLSLTPGSGRLLSPWAGAGRSFAGGPFASCPSLPWPSGG